MRAFCMASGINPGPAKNDVEIRLLSYKFRFKRLFWQEELSVRPSKGEDPVRSVLAHALAEVSGLRPESTKKAQEVIDAIPEAIVTRVWKVYRGSMPPARRFSTVGLYTAPEPSAHMARLQEDEVADDAHDRVVREMESRFGKREVAEEAALSRRVVAAARKGDGAGFAGASQPTPDKKTHGEAKG